MSADTCILLQEMQVLSLLNSQLGRLLTEASMYACDSSLDSKSPSQHICCGMPLARDQHAAYVLRLGKMARHNKAHYVYHC